MTRDAPTSCRASSQRSLRSLEVQPNKAGDHRAKVHPWNDNQLLVYYSLALAYTERIGCQCQIGRPAMEQRGDYCATDATVRQCRHRGPYTRREGSTPSWAQLPAGQKSFDMNWGTTQGSTQPSLNRTISILHHHVQVSGTTTPEIRVAKLTLCRSLKGLLAFSCATHSQVMRPHVSATGVLGPRMREKRRDTVFT